MALRPLTSAALVVVALCCAIGCSPAGHDGLPDGIEVSVHQNRPDTEDRRLQVRITNTTNEAFTITRLSFSSPRFAEPSPYRKAPTTVRAGASIDLPVQLSDPVCEADGGLADGTASVQLEFDTADAAGVAWVVPADPLVQLDGISQRDCLGHAIAAIAAIHAPDVLRTELVDGRLVAMVELAIVPTGAPASFTINAVDDTVLFGLFQSGSPAPLTTLPLNLQVRGDDDPLTVTVPLVPARCDPHAVAEDKRGTLLPLRIETERLSGIHYLAAPDGLKGALYRYVADACAGQRP